MFCYFIFLEFVLFFVFVSWPGFRHLNNLVLDSKRPELLVSLGIYQSFISEFHLFKYSFM